MGRNDSVVGRWGRGGGTRGIPERDAMSDFRNAVDRILCTEGCSTEG